MHPLGSRETGDLLSFLPARAGMITSPRLLQVTSC